MIAGLFCILVAVVLIAWLVRSINQFQLDATRLNLDISKPVPGGRWEISWIGVKPDMAKIGDTFTARIAPTNAAGQPASVFNAQYHVDGGYSVTVAPDGLSAVLVATEAGTGFEVTVEATTAHGAPLTETVALPDVEVAVDDEAVKLNLTVA